MNVSLKWLGTLVDIKGMNPDDMAETLTVDGIPVEHVIRPGEGIKGVITGKILSVENILMRITFLFASWMWVRKNRCRLLPVLPM